MLTNKVFIGIDVSRDKLHLACLKDTENLKVRYKNVPNKPEGYQTLLDWLLKETGVNPEQMRVILEPTNVYHEGIAYFLHDRGCEVCLINPKQVQDFASSLGSLGKNDRKDSVLLARYGVAMQPRRWVPAPLEIRELHALLDRLDTLQDTLQQENNRLDSMLNRENLSTTVIQSLEQSIAFIREAMRKLESQINDHIDGHPDLKQDQRLLETIPGVGKLTAQRMIAVIRSKGFEKASQVAAFLGLVPVERTSGSSVRKRPRLSRRGNPQLRSKLFMPVVSAITHNPVIRGFYQRLLAQKKHQRAAMAAAMRKLVHICFGVLKNQTVFSSAT